MKKINILLIFVVLFISTGCQTMQGAWNNFRSYSMRVKSPVKENEEVEKKPETLKSGSGYLSSREETETMKQTKIISENRNYDDDMTVKSYSRQELEDLVTDLREKLDNEKTALRRNKEELSEVKHTFQKQIFQMDNKLEEEKNKNKDLRSRLTDSELETLKARQTLTEIKTSIFGTRNLFQSTYPVYYTVEKGDSLWKIAAKSKIYDNAYKWLEIYHANQQKIDDHDVIYPGMVLKIPRYFELLMTTFDTQEDVLNRIAAEDEKNLQLVNAKEVSEVNE